ncbi:hypothetical protein ABZ260_51130, partial [Streptosporangium sp. NPDC006013]|uniref:hypothetical protein n=1 Tax=Streptosporangium sp. NPDC006013 TaxID=3155596 RepID=UPI0033AA5F77
GLPLVSQPRSRSSRRSTSTGLVRAQGYDKAGLGVDADNPTGAFGIYTRAGFEIAHRTADYALPLVPRR